MTGCTECNTGYYLKDGECIKCKNTGCTCTISTQCNGCVQGYYLNPELCSECPNYCTSCISSTQCTSCSDGRFGNKCQYLCKENCVHGICLSAKASCQCNIKCVGNKCDSSTGRCLQGCINGYWNQTCDRKCEPECLSCNQADGSCSKCKSSTRYGPGCRQECSNTCKRSECGIYGTCSNGCVANTFGNRCEHTCEVYCKPKDNNTLCSENTGMCLYGCKTGYSGRFCPQEADKQTSSTASLGLGIGGGVVVLSVIVIVGLFFILRRRVNLRNRSETPVREPENLSVFYATVSKGRASQVGYANGDTNNLHFVNNVENHTYQTPPPRRFVKERTPIISEENLEIDEDVAFSRETAVVYEDNCRVHYNNANKVHVADLAEYVQTLLFKDIEEEFQTIPYGLAKAYEVSQMKLNMHKNRYRNIYPYDDTRVLVRGGETDYINASYIDGYRKRNAYIATLGPMAKQLGDYGQFWQMVWQHKVEKIVMMTKLKDEKKTLCEQYWPDQHQSKLYGDVEVVCKVEKLYADFIWRHFTLSRNSEERKLHHLQFTSWPDNDISDDVTSVTEFRQRVNALPSTFDGPVLVHCSAGVGRTGTYIALDILTKEGEAEGVIDIPGCVHNMRQNRPNMIQTLSQYKYLHHALVHTLTLDCLTIRREHFSEYMEKSSKQEIQKQFEKMQLSHENKSDKELQAIAMNRLMTKKNRKHADIPGDSNEPQFNLVLRTSESDCINAIHINSLKTEHRFLVAQTPLPDAVADFIALAVQENCSCIISMGAHLEKHQIKRDVTIPHYDYLDWDTKHNVPMSAQHFVDFIKEVEDVSKASLLKGPILLHCLNGAGKSGLFCVVSTLLEQLSEDNEVSVVNAVQKVRARRPLAIPNKEQFYFCYECVLHSVNAMDNAVYYNMGGDIKRE